MNKDTIRAATAWLTLVLLPVFVSACAGTRTYRELVDDFATNQETRYYADSSAPAKASPPAAETGEGESKDFLGAVEETLISSRTRWEQRLSEPGKEKKLEEFEPGRYQHYRQLAESPQLDEKLAEGVELDVLLGLIHELNPGVKAAQRNLQATLEQYPQAAYLDNILRQYNAFTKQLNTKIGPQNHKEMMAMRFPFPDALALKGKIVSKDVAVAERQTEIALRDALTAARETYYSYLFVDEAIAINRENQQLLEQMIEVVHSKIRSGEAKYNAVIMAQVELSKLADAIITLEEQRETMIVRLNTLLSRPGGAALGPPTPVTDRDLSPALEELYAIALEGRQELEQQRLRIHRMETMVELATRMAYPDPSLGYSYFEDGMRLSSGTDREAPAFMTKRELDHRKTPWFGQRDAYIREIDIKVDAMEEMLTDMEDKTRLMVKKEHFGMERAKRSIALYRHALLLQADQSLEAAGAGYRAGKTDFLTFLDAQRTLLKFRLEEQRALRDYRNSQARLDQLAGHMLPRQPFTLPEQATDKEQE